MRKFMYLRPGNLLKHFVVERSAQETVNESGRVITAYKEEEKATMKAYLAQASTTEKVRYAQMGHPITHIIVQDGSPVAKSGDKLVTGERIFLVQGVDNAGELGISTIYYAEERPDLT